VRNEARGNDHMKKTIRLVVWFLLPAFLQAAPVPSKPVNLLFIMTDQQRWDAMGCAGNPVIKTPHLDRLASEGARFSRFYSSCPVCVPARSCILTGHDIEANQVRSNGDADLEDQPPFPSFDQVLMQNGYVGEYHGKFHSPYRLALGYSRPVRWLNGKKPPAGCEAEMSDAEAFKLYLAERVPARSLRAGELQVGAGIYEPIPLDPDYGNPQPDKKSQATAYGRLVASADTSRTVFTVKEGLAAMKRLQGQTPFTLTISIDPPHPPMVVSDPYYSMYAPEDIPVPESIGDPRTDSPYAKGKKSEEAYSDPDNIRQMRAIYYGMVSQVDDEVGTILKRLDELGLAENTLVVFTSDHGEMLGDHGLHSKGMFYEGAAHVPLLLRLPGVIPANTVIDAPTTHLDLFPTILDYCGQAGHACAGRSLRPLVEGKDDGKGWVAVSEWNSTKVPGFMVFDGRWKYMCGRTADAPSRDALYDLENDPNEMENLIGKGSKYRDEEKRMRGLLIEWLERVKSPCLESVKARPLEG
jgi:arylsulfatase A-like enzyme